MPLLWLVVAAFLLEPHSQTFILWVFTKGDDLEVLVCRIRKPQWATSGRASRIGLVPTPPNRPLLLARTSLQTSLAAPDACRMARTRAWYRTLGMHWASVSPRPL